MIIAFANSESQSKSTYFLDFGSLNSSDKMKSCAFSAVVNRFIFSSFQSNFLLIKILNKDCNLASPDYEAS